MKTIVLITLFALAAIVVVAVSVRHGFVVRRLAQHGLAVPTSEAIYAILQPWAIRNQRAST